MHIWAPTVEDVAQLVPARFGETGPDQYTIPTYDQLEELIERRQVSVRAECGRIDQVDDDNILQLASETVAVGVAAYLSATFFPEQQNAEEAMFLRRRYEEHRRLLRRQVLLWWQANRDDLD